MNIGNFFQLECAFHGNRVLHATAKKQGMMFVSEMFGQGFDRRIERQYLFDKAWQFPSCVTRARSCFSSKPVRRASDMVNNASAASCVVNAFVEATPISGPAWVIMTSSDSRTIELSGTLQIASVET